MKANYKWAVIGSHWVTLSDTRASCSPLWETLIENPKVTKNRNKIEIEGDRVNFDLSFDPRFTELDKYAEPIKKKLFGMKYVSSGWAELKARSWSKHTFYHPAGLIESEGNVSFRWAE